MAKLPDTEPLRAVAARLDEILGTLASGQVVVARDQLIALRRILPQPRPENVVAARGRK